MTHLCNSSENFLWWLAMLEAADSCDWDSWGRKKRLMTLRRTTVVGSSSNWNISPIRVSYLSSWLESQHQGLTKISE